MRELVQTPADLTALAAQGWRIVAGVPAPSPNGLPAWRVLVRCE